MLDHHRLVALRNDGVLDLHTFAARHEYRLLAIDEFVPDMDHRNPSGAGIGDHLGRIVDGPFDAAQRQLARW